MCREATMSVCTSVALVLAQLCGLAAARAAGSNAFRSDYTYWPEAAGWLKLHRVPLDWHTARVQCHYEGIPIEQLYIKWISNTVECKQAENKIKACLAYQTDPDPYYKLQITYYSCEEPLPYFCYRKLSVADELTDCGTVDREYKLDARTGHCYKFHAVGTPWGRAARVCQAEGGYLAVIDSQVEADLLVELFAAHPALLHTPYQNSAAVGFRKWGNDNSWWTIHGMPLEESGYSRWSKGQPDDVGGTQACGAVFRSGLLDDVWCDREQLAFICEKTPRSLVDPPPALVDPPPAFINPFPALVDPPPAFNDDTEHSGIGKKF